MSLYKKRANIAIVCGLLLSLVPSPNCGAAAAYFNTAVGWEKRTISNADNGLNTNINAIWDGTIDNEPISVVAGYSSSGNTVENNSLRICDGKMKETHAGAAWDINETGKAQNARFNQLQIDGAADVGVAVGGFVYEGSAGQNVVSVYDGTVANAIGGHSLSHEGIGTTFRGNVVNVYGGSIGSVMGCLAGGAALASGNIVNISGGRIGAVFGAALFGDNIFSLSEGNTVNLIGRTGRLKALTGYKNGEDYREIIENKNEKLVIDGHVYGSYYSDRSKLSGNNDKLNISGKDISVGNIENFSKMSFWIPSTVSDGEDISNTTWVFSLIALECYQKTIYMIIKE